jgi:hypothetical protein
MECVVKKKCPDSDNGCTCHGFLEYATTNNNNYICDASPKEAKVRIDTVPVAVKYVNIGS